MQAELGWVGGWGLGSLDLQRLDKLERDCSPTDNSTVDVGVAFSRKSP